MLNLIKTKIIPIVDTEYGNIYNMDITRMDNGKSVSVTLINEKKEIMKASDNIKKYFAFIDIFQSIDRYANYYTRDYYNEFLNERKVDIKRTQDKNIYNSIYSIFNADETDTIQDELEDMILKIK